jgi:hypothetical protein
LRDIDASDPRSIHPHMGNDISTFVGNRYVHGLFHVSRLFFGCGDYPACIIERHDLASPFPRFATSIRNIATYLSVCA